MKKHSRGFVDFVREQGVVGLAIGLAIGTQAGILVKDIVATIVDPTIGLLIGNPQGLQAAVWDVSISSRTASFPIGRLIYSLIVFLAVCIVVYFVAKVLKLDRLDKKKDAVAAAPPKRTKPSKKK